MTMATAILGSDGPEHLDGDSDRFDKPCSSPSGSGSGGGSGYSDYEGGKDIERYVKFFTLKSVQVVIQSRLGKKVKTDSKPFSTGTDWFNLNIEDNLEVLEQTKEVLKSQSSEIPIVIEISLQSVTDTNTKLVLELWSILYDRGSDNSPTNSSRVIYNVYNRMSLLLKSLLCVTRSLPAYKLSRKLSLSEDDEFKLYYNVFSAISLFKGDRTGFFKPKLKDFPQGASSPPKDTAEVGMLQEYIDYGSVLGNGYKFNQLGKVVTPYGTLSLELAYRTKMELSTNFSQGACQLVGTPSTPNINKLMIKSDHYAVENSPLENAGQKGLGRQRNRSTPVTFGLGRENIKPLVPGSPNYGGSPSSSPVTTNKKHFAAAFVDDSTLFSPIDEEADLDDMPLGNLLKKSMMMQKNHQNQRNENGKMDAQACPPDQNSKTLTNEETVALVTEQDESSNDFVLVDLKAMPFAGGGSSSSGTVDSSDPIQFFQEVQQAPVSLESLPTNPTGDESGNLITDDDLKTFESEIIIFDDFVKKLISTDQSPPSGD
ncbi:unnamed protein product [Orchesella dallaii]|uniref:Autophagy-related protein 13 n=1 Tax=Orchesella dallaii TaxID=48710 RepID=A0ABP1QXI9_9HEXA